MEKRALKRINYSTGIPWEPLRGYSRAVRVGDVLHVSGTLAADPKGNIVGVGDAYTQTRYIIQILREILREAGYVISDVVRTRLFVTDLSQWSDIAKAHQEAFEKVRPASSIVQVARLMDSRALVEMEVEAVQGCSMPESITIDTLTAND